MVYLAGPISGLTYNDSTDWREKVARVLAPDFTVFSPMRGKESLAAEGVILDGSTTKYEDPMLTDAAIFKRDFNDVWRADLLLINLLGATVPSQGTCFEMAWAYLLHKPVVLVMEDHGNPHEHLFVRQTALVRVQHLSQACDAVHSILLP